MYTTEWFNRIGPKYTITNERINEVMESEDDDKEIGIKNKTKVQDFRSYSLK